MFNLNCTALPQPHQYLFSSLYHCPLSQELNRQTLKTFKFGCPEHRFGFKLCNHFLRWPVSSEMSGIESDRCSSTSSCLLSKYLLTCSIGLVWPVSHHSIACISRCKPYRLPNVRNLRQYVYVQWSFSQYRRSGLVIRPHHLLDRKRVRLLTPSVRGVLDCAYHIKVTEHTVHYPIHLQHAFPFSIELVQLPLASHV